MVIKDIKNFHSNAFQNASKLAIWLENKPSGNPGAQSFAVFMAQRYFFSSESYLSIP
jgi:hypothetical protein